MTEVSRLTLAVDSSQVRGAASDLKRLGDAGQQSERGVNRLGSAFASLRGGLAGLAAGVAAGFAVRPIIQAADTYANLNARLQLVTKSTQELATAQAGLFRIAQSTGTGFEQTADLFGSLSRSTEDLGVSQARVLAVTESINQAITVSGTSAQSASAALTQLGQGFAAGVLRGEELNSILEQTPRLARAIADGLGIPLGKLRELGQAGELSAERVFTALERASKGIQTEFDRLPLTVGRASTEASNALLVLVGALDEATGTSQGLAGAIRETAQFLSDLAAEVRKVAQGGESISFLANAFVLVSESVRILFALTSALFVFIGRQVGAFAAQVGALARLDIQGFRAISNAVKEDTDRARQELDKLLRDIVTRTPKLDLGQTDRRELARRGRPVEGFGSAPQVTLPTRPVRTPRASAGRSEQVSEAQRLLESLERQLRGTQDLTEAERVLAEIQSGRIKLTAGITQQQLVGIAQEIDATREAQRAAQERAQARTADYEAATRAANENAEAERARLKVLIDDTPSQVFRQQQSDIEFLRRALESAKISAEQYGEAVKRVVGEGTDELVKQDKTAESLGLTFASAFEDAIVSGRKFSDVLKGLEQDIIRILARRLITEPLANAVTGAIGGASGGGGFLGNLLGSIFTVGGGKARGGSVQKNSIQRVNELGPELLSTGGRQFLMMGAQSGTVTPNSALGTTNRVLNAPITINVPGNTDRRTASQIALEAARAISRTQQRDA